MTCRNGVWDGYDLTHQFLDDRSTSVYGPGNQTTFQLEASLRMSSCLPVQPVAPQPMPPAHMVIQRQPQPPSQSQPPNYLPHVQQLVPTLTQVAPSALTRYTSAPALRAPHMVLQDAASSSNTELASILTVISPPLARLLLAPHMANRTPSEQAAI